jgi:hypothetical protein
MADADGMEDWNSELENEVSADDLGTLVVYSRDWTVETILSQIAKANIDLAPAFQRRNAWNDHKRSKLIESLIMRVPVPEIVLAEDSDKKGSFLVIDGKQRLLAIAGFFDPIKYPSWDSPKLRELNTRKDLNGRTFSELNGNEIYSGDIRQLTNSDIRCTVISNYKNDQVLYDIFYRLNTGSVPLSSQELRQVLNRGEFANYLIAETNEAKPIHAVMNLSGPDPRLRDAEILLRYIGISLFGGEYKGNLTQFLALTMRKVTKKFGKIEPQIVDIMNDFHKATELLIEIFPAGKVARRYTVDHWETRFNRVLFEVEVYYFSKIDPTLAKAKGSEFIESFQKLSRENKAFSESIESTTKTIERYYTRFQCFQKIVNDVYGLNIDNIPTPAPDL